MHIESASCNSYMNAGLEGMETANNHYIMLFLISICFEATVSINSSPEIHSKGY